MAKKRTFRVLRIIEAVEPKSGLTEELLRIVRCHVPIGLRNVWNWVGEVALVCIACNHRETGRERFNDCLASVGIKKVVSDECK